MRLPGVRIDMPENRVLAVLEVYVSGLNVACLRKLDVGQRRGALVGSIPVGIVRRRDGWREEDIVV